MTGVQAIAHALKSAQGLVGMYLGDLSDADLHVRPVPGANNIAWQLGHLILAEKGLLAEFLPGVNYPALPAGFAEAHVQGEASAEKLKQQVPKAQYLELFNAQRQATIEAIQKLSDADLDRPNTGRMAQFAPTLGQLLLLVANHTMMHAGQFTPIRRKLGKPVMF